MIVTVIRLMAVTMLMVVLVLVLVLVIVMMLVVVRVGMAVRVGLLAVAMGGFGELALFEDMDLGRVNAAAVCFFDLEDCAEVEGVGGVVEDLGGETGVDEGSEEHVATDAGEAV